jgi:two-component system sensor kinase FixL
MSIDVLEKSSPLAGAQPQAPAAPIARLATSPAMRVALMHEFSQPLSAVATYIHAGRRLLEVEEIDRELLAGTMMKAEMEVKRARDVLERLREFVTSEKAERLPVNVIDLTRTVATRLSNEARARGVRIEIEPGPRPIVMADPVQIRQVFVNLLSNAIDAAADMPDGVVRVRCCRESGTIVMEVDDNGRGVASEIAEHLFEPFQTTKSRGMGLGLPLSRQIVEAHGGRIWWERAMPHGTRFHVLLPANASDQYATE